MSAAYKQDPDRWTWDRFLKRRSGLDLTALPDDRLFDEWFTVLMAAVNPSLKDEDQRRQLQAYKGRLSMEFKERGIDI